MRLIIMAMAAALAVFASVPAFAVVTNEYMDPLDAKFNVEWFQCSGCCGDEGCPPNGCATITNECSVPIEVKCGYAAEAQAYFSALRKQVKCYGEIDPKTMKRAPDAPIR